MLLQCFRRFSTAASQAIVSRTALKTIKLRTCVGIYENLKQKYPHIYIHPCPNNGFDIDVSFVDTRELTPNAEKTVVALHGGIGDHTAYKLLIDYFVRQNVRVIAPQFPTFQLTRKTLFYWHSTDEKACVIRDLLRELDVSKVDLLTAHSQGSFTAAALTDKDPKFKNPDVKSLALLAPYFAVQYGAFKKRLFIALASPYQSEIWWKFAETIRIYKLPIFGFRFNSANEHFQLSTTLLDNQDDESWLRRLDHLAHRSDIPVMIIYGTKEKTVEQEYIQRLFRIFGKDYFQSKFVDSLINISGENALKSRVNCIRVDNGGHFVHQHCPELCHELLNRLLNSTK